MTGKELNEILDLGAKQALYREDGTWYHNLTKFPGVLFDRNGYVIFLDPKEYLCNSSLQIKHDLHIKNGICSLNEYIRFSCLEKLYIEENKYFKKIPEQARRIRQEIEVILRNIKLVHEIKLKYDNTCQICGLQLIIGKDKYYSEVHHARPLGKPHNGSDSLDNMICACPNCHVLLDYKMIILNKKDLKKIKHDISETNIVYHNSLVIE